LPLRKVCLTSTLRQAKQRAVRDASVRLRDEWATQCGTAEFRRMEEERRALPITAIRAQLLAALRTADAVVVSGETGSGKSTQVIRRWDPNPT
jgi:HrpA-like RNA helicase